MSLYLAYWVLVCATILIVLAVYYRRRLLIRVMNWSLYTWFLRDVFPYIRYSLYYTKLRGRDYQRGYDILRPGDILLTRDDHKLSTLCIPGRYPHASLCVGRVDRGDDYEVAEMLATGFTKSNFFDLCHEADHVLILRCGDWDADYRAKVVEKCKTFADSPYDFQFTFGARALYCSELVYQADFERRLKVTTADVLGLGIVEYVAPQDILDAPNTYVVWDSDEEAK